MDKAMASGLAKDYLQRLPFKEMFKPEPVKVNDKGEYFEVWFQRVVPSKPKHGLIRVQKKSGSPNWVPLR